MSATFDHHLNQLKKNPRNPAAHFAVGCTYLERNELVRAISHLQSAHQCAPRDVEILNVLGCATQLYGQLRQAETVFRRGLLLNERHPLLRLNLGGVLTSLGRFDEAIEHYRFVLATSPDLNIRTIPSLAATLEKSGKPEEALGLLKPYLNDSPPFPIVRTLADLVIQHKSFAGHTDFCIERLELLRSTNQIPRGEVSRSLFLLGDLYQKKKALDAAWGCYRSAHELAAKIEENPPLPEQISKLKERFATLSPNIGESPGGKFTPIIITGMPRSGSSLLEQILSANSGITPLGESGLFHAAVCELTDDPDIQWGCTPLSDELRFSVANLFRRKVRLEFPPNKMVSDKSLEYIFLVGQIVQAFPDARILLTRRDPRDTCISCYTHDFAGRHSYQHSLTTLAQRANILNDLADFWQKLYPENCMIARYEAIVSHPEEEIRKIVEFCNLEWTPDYLTPHQKKRVVITASYNQVTQPINAGSIARWKQFEPYIGELLNALELPVEYQQTGNPE